MNRNFFEAIEKRMTQEAKPKQVPALLQPLKSIVETSQKADILPTAKQKRKYTRKAV